MRIAPSLVLGLGQLACTGSVTCTDAGCEHESTVTFPPGFITGAYDLVLESSGETVVARCRDPGAPETADNPAGLQCDAMGFVLRGHPLANERELKISVNPTDGGEPTIAVVRLEAVDELTPNGPDCPPICVIRNGQFSRSGG